MASTAGMYVNLVKYRTDRQSYKKVRDEAKRLQKDFNKILKGEGGSTPFSPYQDKPKPRMRQQDAHIKARTKELKKQAAFDVAKEVRIERFVNTLKGVDDAQKSIYRTELMRQNTAIGLVRRQQEIRKFTQDNYRTQQKITAEMNKQNVAAKRFHGSMNQLAGSFVSVYSGLEVGTALIQTGIGFEAINKTLLAVSDSSEQAAENFEFVRQTAMKFGSDIIQTGKQFGKVIAAGRGKLGLDEMKETFVAVSEASVALGLSQDQVGRSFNAINQMLSKGQIYAEELRGQLGEHLPFAMQAMARATQDIGLIDKSITDIGELEKQLNKLMEQGKLVSKDVIPAFSRQLRKLAAGDLDAVNVALRDNLNPQLGIAMNNLKLFGDAIFKAGVKDAVFLATKGFNTLMKETGVLADFIGGWLNGAITGLTFPFRLATAAVLDLRHIIKQTFNVTDEMEKSFFSLTGTILGTVAGLSLLYFGFKKITGLGKTLKGAKSTVETLGEVISGKDGKGGLFSGMKGATPTNPLYVVVVGDTGDVMDSGDGKGKKPKGGKYRGSVGSVIRKVAPVVAEVGAGVALGAMFNAKPYIPNADLTAGSGYMTPEQMSKAMKDTIKVDVTVNPDSNGFMYKVEKTIDNKIIRSQDDMIRDAYMQQ